jgi:hypothetical protein
MHCGSWSLVSLFCPTEDRKYDTLQFIPIQRDRGCRAVVHVLKQLVGTVGDVNSGVLLQHLDEPLQLGQLILHLGGFYERDNMNVILMTFALRCRLYKVSVRSESPW